MKPSMLPLVPLHARGLLHQPVPDHHRRVQPPQKQSREQSHRRTPSLPLIAGSQSRVTPSLHNSSSQQRTVRLPPPSPLSQNAYPNAFDPQLHFDANVKRISHALAPPSILDRYNQPRARESMHIRNRPPPRPFDDRPLFFDEPDPIAPLPLFVQELPRLARGVSENDRLPRRVEMRDEEDFQPQLPVHVPPPPPPPPPPPLPKQPLARMDRLPPPNAHAKNAHLHSADVIHAIHDFAYIKLACEERTVMDGHPRQHLRDIALRYINEREGIRIRGGLDALRQLGLGCVPHPLVKIALSLLGWADLKAGGVAADWVTTTWGQPEQEAALWLLLDWLYPSKALLYPLDDDGGDGASKKPAAKRGGRRDPAELLLPPKMLLPYGAVPRILACLGRRKLFNVSEATPYLTQAAAALIELDAGGRPVVDIEEMILYWMELWGCWDTSRWPRDVDRIPPAPEKLPPRERCRKSTKAEERPPLRVKLKRARMEQTNHLIL